MHLIRLFKVCKLAKSTKTINIDGKNPFDDLRAFETSTNIYGKYKKTYETHGNIAIISNYKNNKLHGCSKYVNLMMDITQSKYIMLINKKLTKFTSYIQYKNGIIVYMYYSFTLNNCPITVEYYFVNKCLIKLIQNIDGNVEYFDYYYEENKIDKIDKVNVVYSMVNGRLTKRLRNIEDSFSESINNDNIGYNLNPKEKVNFVYSFIKNIISNITFKDNILEIYDDIHNNKSSNMLLNITALTLLILSNCVIYNRLKNNI